MIRDPSDGSIRGADQNAGFSGIKPETPYIDNDLTSTTSGLRAASEKLGYQQRLEASREWLKDYKARKASQWHAPGAGNPTTPARSTTDDPPTS